MVGRTVVRPYIRLFEPSNYGVVKGNWYKPRPGELLPVA